MIHVISQENSKLEDILEHCLQIQFDGSVCWKIKRKGSRYWWYVAIMHTNGVLSHDPDVIQRLLRIGVQE